ncbi:MAG TPA: pyridoxal-dependent decarboxylase [Candidatus Dormibacteraeota bacterium]|nr:pyridoxal-dependent decarboxylase [Candidatus Dormibacteraeota bacterium]
MEPHAAATDRSEFARAAERAAAWTARYLEDVGSLPVLSRVRPGEIAARLPAAMPEEGESLDALLDDLDRIVLPGITHWNHPRFFAYFAITGSEPGVLAEIISAALNVNAMLWRTSPAATEIEEVALRWLRQALGIPDSFFGVVYDTASVSGLHALAAARESLGLDVRNLGMSGRNLPALRVYCTEQTHSHIEKDAILLGIGRENVVKVPTDDAFRMDPAELARLVDEDRAAGRLPMCVAATVGTTSTTSVDPVPEIARVCKERGLWLHVDAAYAGPAAIVPELRWLMDGVQHADSLVVNPHKWMFVPVDCSVLYTRHEPLLRRAFSLVAAYLETPESDVRNYMDYGVQLGRRFRGLKLWFVLRFYGRRRLAELLRGHVAMAQELAAGIVREPDFEILAPHPLSVVCLRHVPADLRGDETALDAHNAALAERVNATGFAFISTTRLRGRTALRMAIGNARTTARDVRDTWDVIVRLAREAVASKT